MLEIFILFISFFIVAYFAIPQIVKFAIQRKLVDVPDHRKVHRTLIPALGGVAVFLCIVLAYIYSIKNLDKTAIAILLGASIIFFTGVVDDIKPQKAMLKLGLQILSAFIIVVYGDIRIHSLFGTYGIYQLNYIISVLISLFIVLTFINAMNLIDGINGLAASLGILYFSFFAFFYYTNGQNFYLYISLAFIGSLLAFLRYNLFKPIIFLGDTGSTIIGLFSSVFLLDFFNYDENSLRAIQIYCPYGIMLSLFILPLFDTFRVALQRILKEKSPFSPDKTHIHHLFLRLDFKHYHITFILVLCNILFFGISFIFQQYLGDLLIVTMILGLFVLGFIILEFFIMKKFKMRYNDSITIEKIRVFLGEYWFLFFSFIVFTLPFQRWATSIPMLLYSLLWLLTIRKSDLVIDRHKLRSILLPSLIFFLPLIYFVVFERNGIFLERNLSLYIPFLLFPLVLFLKKEQFSLKKWYDILAFCLLGILTFAFAFTAIVIVKFLSGTEDTIFMDNRLLLSNIPIIYYSLFLNFGVMVTIYLRKSSIKLLQNSKISFLILGFLSINMLIIHSKIGFFALLLILFFASIIQFVQHRKISVPAYILGLLIIYSSIFILKSEKFNIEYQKGTSSEVTKRLNQWNASLYLIAEAPIQGFGSNSSLELGKLTGQNINAHNQIFQMSLDYGVLGNLFFIIVLAYSFAYAIMSKDFFYKGFLALIIYYCLFESLFTNQSGIVFFSIFNSLLILKSKLRIKTASS